MERVGTVVIGAGYAGISLSYELKKRGIEHVVLDKAPKIFDSWRSHRWDSFKLNTNWKFSRLPGQVDDVDDDLMGAPVKEVIAGWEAHVVSHKLPVELNSNITAGTDDASGNLLVKFQRGDTSITYSTRNVVGCCGFLQNPHIPEVLSASFPSSVHQTYAGKYTNPGCLQEGGVLVVGNGSTGVQIAEELIQANKKVYLATSNMASVFRSFRGLDLFETLKRVNMIGQPKEALSHPDTMIYGVKIPFTGADHPITLHSLARQGVELLGTLEGVHDDVIQFKDNLKEHVDFADNAANTFFDTVKSIADTMPEAFEGCPPAEVEPEMQPYEPQSQASITQLKLSDIGNVFWATGFDWNIDWVKVPSVIEAFGKEGKPVSCETPHPGFFWIGNDWMRTRESGNIIGISPDAQFVAEKITQGKHLHLKNFT